MEDQTAILLLAAGSSSRLGSPKQLLDVAGEPLIRRVAKQLVDLAAGPVGVVLGANRALITPELAALPLTTIVNDDWSLGMGSSIAAGMRWVVDLDVDAVLIVLCDQPAIDATHLHRLLARLGREEELVATGYADSLGVPAVFHRCIFPRLLQLPPDRGAKEVLLDERLKRAIVPCEAARVDLDTPEDAARWRSSSMIPSPGTPGEGEGHVRRGASRSSNKPSA